MIQLITPNPHIWCAPGWCLQYVRQAFGLPARHPTATSAWEASTSKHRDRKFPAGVWYPIWFSLSNEPAGHVALVAPDGSVFSTSDLSNKPHQHLDISDLMNYYARYGMTLTYLGWTEDVAGYPVISPNGIAAMGTTTPAPVEEIDMAAVDTLMAQLNQMVEWEDGRFQALKGEIQSVAANAHRAAEVAQATEDRGDSAKIALLFQMLSQIAPQFRFFKGPSDDSLYELEGGELRGISLAEWQAKGGTEPAPLAQEDIDKLLPKP